MKAGFLVMVMLGVGCKSAAPPPLPEGLEWVQASADPLQWLAAGFLEVVTPVRPPTSADRTSRIAVFVQLPAGPPVTTVDDAETLRTLKMPKGTIAVRVEYAAPGIDADAPVANDWRVLDVRQLEWTPSGRRCVVLRPANASGLAGLGWRCGASEDAQAGEALANLIRTGQLRGSTDPEQRSAAGARLARINDCSTCHGARKPEDRRPGVLVQRGTDSEGLFSIRAAFSDESPLELYRPVDPNRDDPLLTSVCPDSEYDPSAGSCRDGQHARLRLDVRKGVATNNRHVLQVCAARLRLAARVDEDGRAALGPLLAECE